MKLDMYSNLIKFKLKPMIINLNQTPYLICVKKIIYESCVICLVYKYIRKMYHVGKRYLSLYKL